MSIKFADMVELFLKERRRSFMRYERSVITVILSRLGFHNLNNCAITLFIEAGLNFEGKKIQVLIIGYLSSSTRTEFKTSSLLEAGQTIIQ